MRSLFHFESVPYDGNDLSRRQLLRISSCCGRMIAGLLLCVVFMVGVAHLPYTYGLDLPSCILGFLIIYSGVIPLSLVHGITPNWHNMSRASLCLGILILYFTPFLFWWASQPNDLYYAVNGVLCLISITGLLALLNAMASGYARRVEDEAFHLEARLSMWAVLAIYGIPLMAALFFCVGFIMRHQSNPLAQLRLSLSNVLDFLVMIACIPLALTSINLWKTRQKCIELIRQ